MMENNINKADRGIKIIIAAILATLFFKDVISGVVGFVLFIYAVVLVINAVFNYYPFYSLFEINTNTKKE